MDTIEWSYDMDRNILSYIIYIEKVTADLDLKKKTKTKKKKKKQKSVRRLFACYKLNDLKYFEGQNSKF